MDGLAELETHRDEYAPQANINCCQMSGQSDSFEIQDVTDNQHKKDARHAQMLQSIHRLDKFRSLAGLLLINELFNDESC